jgi:streptogramin lyase
MTGPSNIGTTATNIVGLTNAFATVNIIANTGTGVAGGTTVPAGATLPTAKLNTLADMLASCVNSSGGTASNTATACGTLFNATTVGSSVPTDTITAAMNMAQNPGLASTTLMALATPASPFQPTVASMTDLSLVIKYTGGGLSTPKGIATDGSGNVWLPNSGNNSVTKLSNAGMALSGTNGFTAGPLNSPSSIAVDTGGNAWVTNSGNSSVTELNPAGSVGTVFSGTLFNTPSGVAIDGSGNAWVANSGNNSVTQISTTQAVTNYSGAGVVAPAAIAIDPK